MVDWCASPSTMVPHHTQFPVSSLQLGLASCTADPGNLPVRAISRQPQLPETALWLACCLASYRSALPCPVSPLTVPPLLHLHLQLDPALTSPKLAAAGNPSDQSRDHRNVWS
ncbi:hypothetical protein Pmani_038236 [Petrolisthes manimaculis]|uniref:Uncharacterized protein n=1 Tax=Petrolisthes manimaculis TaxID=1843537 RepID=A0AAE1TKG3_9EUCA|nr:hypothetical protein Pmani_038236 [Petrolisthes manimaculis]